MEKPCIAWGKYDYFLGEKWCSKDAEFFGELEKDIRKINNKSDELCPTTFLRKDGIEERVVFYDNIVYVYGYKGDTFQVDCSRQFDVTKGSGQLHDYLLECAKTAAAA